MSEKIFDGVDMTCDKCGVNEIHDRDWFWQIVEEHVRVVDGDDGEEEMEIEDFSPVDLFKFCSRTCLDAWKSEHLG